MKKTFFFLSVLLFIFSCQESLVERAEREAATYTKKQCPFVLAENIIMDSMTFDSSTLTFGYHYHLTGALDTMGLADQTRWSQEILKGLKNDPGMKAYMDNSFKYRYVYRSTKSPEEIIFETLIAESDYKQ